MPINWNPGKWNFTALLDAISNLGLVRLPHTALLLLHLSPLPISHTYNNDCSNSSFSNMCHLPDTSATNELHSFMFGHKKPRLSEFRSALLLLTLKNNYSSHDNELAVDYDSDLQVIMQIGYVISKSWISWCYLS
jgi:hypothetical protein